MLKKLSVIILCQFVTSTWALTADVLPVDPLKSTCQLQYGVSDGSACQLSMTTATDCQTKTCKAYSCTNSCICAPNATYCSSLDGTSSDCPNTFCPEGTSNWAAPEIGAAYQERTTYTLNKITCKCTTRTEYRCAVGYYDANTTTFGTNASDCTKCPAPTDNISSAKFGAGATSSAGAKGITSCYIPMATGNLLSDITLTDESGTYSFTADCHYTE